MTKTKTPFFSLGSQGSIANAITSQRKGSDTILRQKPTPTYRQTLAQMYQRWLYEDYAYLWTQQSIPTKQLYATAGSRHHLTAFQYWMKYNLTNLPDIAGLWKLDHSTDPIAYDSSRNANNGTIFGTTSTLGVINGALDFDGINDAIQIPTSPSLDITAAITIEATLYVPSLLAVTETVVAKYWFDSNYMLRKLANGKIIFDLFDPNSKSVTSDNPIQAATFTHLLGTATPGATMNLYIDGIKQSGTAPFTGVMPVTIDDVRIGGKAPGPWEQLTGIIDNVIIYNRPFDDTEALRHSLRRYPP